MQTGMCCCICASTILWFRTGLGITRGWLASQTTGRLYIRQRVSRKAQALKALLQNPTQVNSPARLQLHVSKAVAQQTTGAYAVPATSLRNRDCSAMSSKTRYGAAYETLYIMHQSDASDNAHARLRLITAVGLRGKITPVEKLPDMPGYVCRRQPWRFSKDAPCGCENCWLPSKQEAGLLALRHLTQQNPLGHGET